MRTTRREFLKHAGATVAATAAFAPAINVSGSLIQTGTSSSVAIVSDPADVIANSGPVRWAIEQLCSSLAERQISAQSAMKIEDVRKGIHCIVVTSSSQPQPIARQVFGLAHLDRPQVEESLALVLGKVGNRTILVACGYDTRGLVYALLELADAVKHSSQPLEALTFREPVFERPANQIRSNMRVFASDVEDKSWFNDRGYWRSYLSMLAGQRFNRFSLALGLGYDFTSGIRDAYFHFAYPFLVTVPGYDVQVTGISEAERESNLQMLRFISDEAVARGLHFQLGIWTHAYRWTNSPQANHLIEGLTPDRHADYCRDALRTLLVACPAIGGVTFRIHGESGVAEGSYAFWKTVFQGLTQCGRQIDLDMHAKGMDSEMIKVAVATGLPVTISPKFWAEHMGLPYHQAAIRPTEMPPHGAKDEGFFSKSSGSRSFLRYGYGDLLAEGRPYKVLYRIWPGTQRLLLWGDPVLAAGYGRASSFCGSNGVELFEPLSFKGRKGSGIPGGRDGYADASLKPAAGDFEKYLYGYRLWGRLLYNPETKPEVWQRHLNKEYGRASNALEMALGNASRILPLITTAHMPSAANNNYWPEIYANMAIVDLNLKHPYGDTPNPKRFGTVSPLDPQLFSRVDDFADELINGTVSGKISPLQVSDWLLGFSNTATREMEKAQKVTHDVRDVAFRRVAADVRIQIGLGQFFAWKLRAGVLYALYERTGDRDLLEQALAVYRQARQAWSQVAGAATGVYVPDITFGLESQLRGHWQDRLGAIDQDIADMQKRLSQSPPGMYSKDALARVSRAMNRKSHTFAMSVKHAPPSSFQCGLPLRISLNLSPGLALAHLPAVRLYYRHTNQAEQFRTAEMLSEAGTLQTVIPAQYTNSAFPLQYYFELRDHKGDAWLYPGLGPHLTDQPYYVVRQAQR